MATSWYCKISLEEWKECSAEPMAEVFDMTEQQKQRLYVYGADFLLLIICTVCAVCGDVRES